MALKNGLSEELNRQGNEHFSRGHYTEAYACYAKALECDRLTGDQRNVRRRICVCRIEAVEFSQPKIQPRVISVDEFEDAAIFDHHGLEKQ